MAKGDRGVSFSDKWRLAGTVMRSAEGRSESWAFLGDKMGPLGFSLLTQIGRVFSLQLVI